MAESGVIAAYLAGLDRGLPGPAAVQAELLAETRDSLYDAAAAYLAGGVPAALAEHRAVADFGPLPRILAEYRAELAVAQGSRLLRSALFVLPVMHLIWEFNRMIWMGSWDAFGVVPPPWYGWVAEGNDLAPWVGAALAGGVLLLGRWLSRGAQENRRLVRLAGVTAAAAIGLCLLGNVLIVLASWSVNPVLLGFSPVVAAATLASLVILGRLTQLSHRCLRLAV